MNTYDIAIVVGSNRRDSINRKLSEALAKLADLPAHTHDASGAEADRKRAVIEAALARAKARRGNG